MFRVPRNEDLIKALKDKAVEFWDYVKKDVPPPDSLPHLEVLKRIKRVPNKIVDIPSDLVMAREKARLVKKEAEAAFDCADIRLKTALDNAEQGNYEGGIVTFFEQYRSGFTVKPTTFRVLRIKAKKGA